MMNITYSKPLDEVIRECQKLPRNVKHPKSLHYHMLTQIHNMAVHDKGFADMVEFQIHCDFIGPVEIDTIDDYIRQHANKKGEWLYGILRTYGVYDLAKRFFASDHKKREA